MIAESAVADPFRATDSLAFASREANVDAPRRDLGILLAAHEVDLGDPDIGISGKLPHLVHGRPVPDGIVDRRLAQAVCSH